MKELKIILVVLMIAVPVWTVYRYVEVMSPVWQDAARQQAAIDLKLSQQAAIVDAAAHAQRAQDWTEIQRSLLIIVVLGVCSWIAVTIWAHYDKRRESWARMVDGSYALQTFRAGGQVWVTDPNKQIFGVLGQDTKTGVLTTDASIVGPDRQLTYAQTVQQTRTASAMMPENGVKFAAHAKLLAGAYTPHTVTADQGQGEADPSEMQPFTPITCFEAFSQSTMHKWVLGQNRDTGELFTLDMKTASHFGICGSNGTGKTAYVGLMLMALAIKHNYRVVILDGKGGADWSKFRNLVEYYPLDYSNVGEFVSQLTQEYQYRQAILNQHQANSIWELPKAIVIPRPTVIIIDEFGATMDSLRAASKAEYAKVELELGNLLRLSRGAGLYIVPTDQNPTKWPSTVRANLPMNVCFRLGGNIDIAG